jgi:hypothetical protein
MTCGTMATTNFLVGSQNRGDRLAIVFRREQLRVDLRVYAIAAQGLNARASEDERTARAKRAGSCFLNGSMSPDGVFGRKEVKRDTGDGGGANADATLVGVVKCAVKLIVAIRLTRAYQELATWHPFGYE